MSQMILVILYMLILFVSNVLGAVGGFGAGMISIPFLTQIFDAKAVIMASTMTCILNVFIAIKNWRYINIRQFFRIVLYMCIGLPIGVYGLKIININVLKLILGAFMVMVGLYGLLKLWFPRAAKAYLPSWIQKLCLIAGGVIQGAISSGGSLVLLYAQQELKDKSQFRATMALLWTAVSLITVIQYIVMGTMTRKSAGLFAVGAPAVLLGIYAGGKLCGHLSQRAFVYVINGLILFAGVISWCTNVRQVFH